MKLGGKGFLLFAELQPETPGRLADHAYAYEAMEWAAYEMLRRFAQHAGDEATAAVAISIGAEERAMMERLERDFDEAEEVSHSTVLPKDIPKHLRTHLIEVHAFEMQGIELLEKSENIAATPQLQDVYSRMLGKVRQHASYVERRLEMLDSRPSTIKDAAMKLGGLNWGLFFHAQSDTPAKLAAFVYAVLHLQIGGYELLKRTARRASHAETEGLCQTIITEKAELSTRLSNSFDGAVEATLDLLLK